MDNRILDNITELIDTRNIDKIVIDSIKEIRFNKKSLWQYVVSCVIGSITAYIVAFNYGTVSVMAEITVLLFNTSIVTVGVVLGAYSIFQALMQKELVLILIKSDKNLLSTGNKSFLNLIILNVINAVISLTAKIILSAMGKEFYVFDNMRLNNTISTVLILFYIVFNLLLLMELIVFATNLYRMFCVYNVISALNVVKDDQEK